MTSDPTSYAEADRLLGSRASRKIANNTYLQRRDDAIAVMLHETDVVTYERNGDIVLATGGWLTTVTKERINRFAPPWIRLFSERGRWMVTHERTTKTYADGTPIKTPNYDTAVGFAEGIRLRPYADCSYRWHVLDGLTDELRALQDAHNRQIERLLHRYLRGYERHYPTVAARSLGLSHSWPQPHNGCAMCVRTGVGTLVGDVMGDRQHLIDHMIERVYPYNLLIVASEYAAADRGEFRLLASYELSRRDLRRYLRQQLYVGTVALAHGKRPAHAPSWQLALAKGAAA